MHDKCSYFPLLLFTASFIIHIASLHVLPVIGYDNIASIVIVLQVVTMKLQFWGRLHSIKKKKKERSQGDIKVIGCKMKENSSQEEQTGRRRPNCCFRKFTSAYLEKTSKKKDCKQLNKCDMQFGELANCVLVSWYKESCNRSSAKPWEI